MHVQLIRYPFRQHRHDAAVAEFVSTDDLRGHGTDAEPLQNILLAHLKVVGASPHLRRQLISPFVFGHRELVWPAEAEVDEGQVSNCLGSTSGSASCPTKSGEAQRKSARLNTFRAISVESCSGPLPNTTSKPSLIGSTMLSTSRMSNRECLG